MKTAFVLLLQKYNKTEQLKLIEFTFTLNSQVQNDLMALHKTKLDTIANKTRCEIKFI